MKVISVMMLVCVMSLGASNVVSQNAVINIRKSNVSVANLLDEIERQTNYLVVYKNRDVDLSENVILKKGRARVKDVLNEVANQTHMSYLFDNNYIILKPKNEIYSRVSYGRKSAESEMLVQEKKQVKGTIKNEKGESIIGATITLKGTKEGAISDIDGNYSIGINDDNDVLTVTYVGYVSQEIPLRGRSRVDIVLKEDVKALNEVVVVGYGTEKKINLTGSVTSVNFDNDLTSSRPITNLTTALSGTIPGLNVIQGSGTPGADGATLRVRGVGSLNAGQDPLVLVDGQPGDISQISANDIASVSVLKDAASAAIYGSRASNGVVLVTTKRGSNTGGKIQFDYSSNIGWSKPTRLPDLITNSADWMQMVNLVDNNSGRASLYSTDFINQWRTLSKSDPLKYPNTNWWDALYNNTNMIQTHQLSLRGGDNHISSFTSLNYQKNDGLMNNTAYEVFNLRCNTDYVVNDILKLGMDLSGMIGRNQAGDLGAMFQWFSTATPAIVPRSPDGRYGDNQTGSGSANNPLWILEDNQGSKSKNRFTGKFFAVLTPMKGLTINASYFRDLYDYKENIIVTDFPRYDFRLNVQTTTGTQGIITNDDSNTDEYIIDLFASYNKKFANKHNFTALVGYNKDYNKDWGFNARKAGLMSLSTPVLSAASDLQSADGWKGDYAMLSYFGRLNYDYKGKYLLETNMRYDGSSRFAPGHRWGFFPSVSAGWRISEESFWENYRKIVDNLKTRVSYGRLGNNGIGNYDWQNVYDPLNTVFGNVITQGVVMNNIANDKISWEKTDVFDLGIDVNVLNSISLTFDYYNKLTHGILYRNPIPYVNGGLGAPMENSAKVRNRGFEFSSSYNKSFGPLGLSVSFNGGYNQNRIIKYKGSYLEINGATVWTEGQPIGKFYVREVDHIIKSQAEVDKLISEGYSFSPTTPGPGDFLYKDLNHDKKIDDNDRVLKGQPIPLFTYGGSFGLTYKGFDFNVLLSGIGGWNKYLTGSLFGLNSAGDQRMYLKKFENQWTPSNTNATIPKLYVSDTRNDQISDYYLVDASFLKVKTVQLGYTIPKFLTDKFKINQIRFFSDLENFFTFTSYPGMDPEMGGEIGYPILKTISVGVNIKF